ncbi:MAG: UMP kinase [Methanosarcina flavescens]|jgi:uridylate kinase|uniref:Uridylate kinase n=1 Tax=Methanosarcina flavescens TaxID=1715806 RepID=A0A660HQT0_9EURY|nr:UMP kinase [Methanosarcina flavescens]AYK14651.1 UMP kinase [Methanosarcina flavescens]NLK32410.1 UMP kinase [Methanosarcina flavescens]
MLIVLSLGGSILAKNLDPDSFLEYAEVLRKISKKHTLLVVAGGGEVARSYIDTARAVGADEVTCDYIGIEITRLNARLLAAALGPDASPEIPTNYLETAKAIRPGKVVVMGGVTPGQTTDAVAAILAEFLRADLLIIATSIDGVYSADPNCDPSAVKYDRISPEKLINIVMSIEMKAGSKSPVDPVAAKIIERCKLDALVMDARNPATLGQILDRETAKKSPISCGTWITAKL